MISEAKTWLKGILEAAGMARVYTDSKDLERKHALPYAVLLVDRERLERQGQRVATKTEGSVRTYRRRLWSRAVPISVVLVHRSEDQVEPVLDDLLREVFGGLLVGEDRVPVRAERATWIDEGSTIMKQNMVEVPIIFEHGVYKDETVNLFENVAPEPDGIGAPEEET
jgi:hypothetical protein